MDNITEINTKNFDFSQMIMSNGLPDNENLTSYNEYLFKKYAEKVINTGYSIKKSVKKIDYNVNVPVLFRDVSNYGYDIFTKYYNGGYNRHLNGCTNGFKDKIVFGYINTIADTIYVTNDLYFEANMFSIESAEVPTEIKWIHSSRTLYYDEETSLFRYIDEDAYKTLKFASYKTLSPYLFDDVKVTKSLEMEKPVYDFANIKDINYTETVTHYYEFFRKMIIDKYDSNTHIISAKILIDGELDRYKIYNINGTHYIVSEVVEYDPTKADLYEVKLMKVNYWYNYVYPLGSQELLPIELVETSVNYKGEWDFYGSYIDYDIVKVTAIDLTYEYYEAIPYISHNQRAPNNFPSVWRLMYQ